MKQTQKPLKLVIRVVVWDLPKKFPVKMFS